MLHLCCFFTLCYVSMFCPAGTAYITYKLYMYTLTPSPCSSGLALPSPGELLRLQTHGEERVHRVHDDGVGRLSGSQRVGAAPPGLEALLQVPQILLNTRDGKSTHILYSSRSTDTRI